MDSASGASIGAQKLERNDVDSFLLTAAYSKTAPEVLRSAASSKGWQAANAQEAYLRDEIEQAVRLQAEQLKDAISLFKTHARAKYIVDIDLDSAHSLHEVVKALSDFRVQQNERTGFWARIGRIFEAISDRSAIYKQWLELLPTQDHYLSVLCGGLKLIIGAMQRMKKVREEVLSAFENLPNLLLCGERTDVIFPDDFELRACSKKMLGKTFEILRLIVLELHRSTVKTLGKALLRQGLYAEKLSMRLEEMEQLRRMWQDTAATSGLIVLRGLETTVDHLSGQIVEEHRETRAAMEQILHDQLEQFLRSFCCGMHKSRMLEICHKPDLAVIPHGKPDSKPWLSPPFAQFSRRPGGSFAESNPWAGPAEVQDRLHILVADARFKSWFSSAISGALVMHENRRHRGHPSAASYLCARASQSINSQVVTSSCIPICIYFSCGSHICDDDDDLFCGPSGMLRSFLDQLVQHATDQNLGDDVVKAMRHIRRDSYDVTSLLKRLIKIVQQLPDRIVVYCILDDITAYEIAEWREEATHVVDGLSGLTVDGATTCVFKLLLTSPESCKRLHHCVPREDVLEVPLHVPRIGDFSEKAWEVATEDGISSERSC